MPYLLSASISSKAQLKKNYSFMQQGKEEILFPHPMLKQ